MQIVVLDNKRNKCREALRAQQKEGGRITDASGIIHVHYSFQTPDHRGCVLVIRLLKWTHQNA